MLKYADTMVTFSEIPDEITLCINITRCKIGCKNCHSSYLAEDIGKVLMVGSLRNLINRNEGITCISFMGGDADSSRINALAQWVKNNYTIKVAWYSGRQELSEEIDLKNFDYIKLGPYIEEFGPLNSKTTNQKFYKVENISYKDGSFRYELIDITYKFHRNEN